MSEEVLIKINNAGQRVVSTNYWDTVFAKKGYFFLSWNAGAARLFVPKSQEVEMKEMKTGKEIIISRGLLYPENRDALELLFEDNSNKPFAIQMTTEQSDRLIKCSDLDNNFIVTIWTESSMQFQRPGRYRVVNKIPCLEPWSTQ